MSTILTEKRGGSLTNRGRVIWYNFCHEADRHVHLRFPDVAGEGARLCRHAAAFASDCRRVYYVGANYNPAADVRTIDDVKCERAQGETE